MHNTPSGSQLNCNLITSFFQIIIMSVNLVLTWFQWVLAEFSCHNCILFRTWNGFILSFPWSGPSWPWNIAQGWILLPRTKVEQEDSWFLNQFDALLQWIRTGQRGSPVQVHRTEMRSARTIKSRGPQTVDTNSCQSLSLVNLYCQVL